MNVQWKWFSNLQDINNLKWVDIPLKWIDQSTKSKLFSLALQLYLLKPGLYINIFPTPPHQQDLTQSQF